MKVLLNEAVKNVGRAGEIKEVKDGYARNFLLPRGMASMATVGALRQAEAQRQSEERREARNLSQNEALGAKIAATSLTLHARVGEQGRLYGAITAADIATALSEKVGRPIDRRRVELEEPIRQLGEYKIPVRVARNVVPQVSITVEGEA